MRYIQNDKMNEVTLELEGCDLNRIISEGVSVLHDISIMLGMKNYTLKQSKPLNAIKESDVDVCWEGNGVKVRASYSRYGIAKIEYTSSEKGDQIRELLENKLHGYTIK